MPISREPQTSSHPAAASSREHGGLAHPGGPGIADRGGRQLTRSAVSATLHCLTGCAIGEVLGLVLATWWGLSNAPSIAVAVVLAFVFGYSLTIASVLRSGLPVKAAVAVALAADTVSIITMEIMDNAIMLAIPGAMNAGLTDLLFWGSLILSLLVAFVVTVPVNPFPHRPWQGPRRGASVPPLTRPGRCVRLVIGSDPRRRRAPCRRLTTVPTPEGGSLGAARLADHPVLGRARARLRQRRADPA